MVNIDDLTVKEIKHIQRFLRKMGFRCLKAKHKNANGPDIWAIKDNTAFSIEIKKARRLKSNSIQVPPVEHGRRNDDLIAICLPSGYVLIEPMSQHLKTCSGKGYRVLGPIC